MKKRRGIVVETTATVEDDCDISCEAIDEELQFHFGPRIDGLQLCFDWRGLCKFMRVANEAIKLRKKIKPCGVHDFTVHADRRSFTAHTLNCTPAPGDPMVIVLDEP